MKPQDEAIQLQQNSSVENQPTQESNKKDNKDNPLSVRIDPHYKEKFEALTEEMGLSKKMMLESLIAGFIEKEEQNQRTAQLNFNNEISLIAAGLEEILTLFNHIAAKSQDTIGSLKSHYEQKIANLETQLLTRDERLAALEEKQQLAKASGQTLQLEKEKLEQEQVDLKEALANKETELQALQYKNLELLEQLNLQRKVERENLLLHTEVEKATAEIKRLKDALEEQQSENARFQKKITQLETDLTENQTGQNAALDQLEKRIRQEAELDKKTALLQFQSEYNNLQAENLRNLTEINQKTAELSEMKIRLAELGKS